jgi:transcriptional regulator with XRE-family HTH domain
VKYPNTLKALRLKRELTQEEVCRKLFDDQGVKLSVRQYSRYETGVAEPPLSMARHIAAALCNFNCLEIWWPPWEE